METETKTDERRRGGDRRAGKTRVVIVDGHTLFRRGVRNILELENDIEVVGEAGNGQEAVQRYAELRPDVMTLDITMPEKDGISALKEIIASDPGAKVVMCSALGQESKVLESIKLGARDFVVKPFQPDRVLDAVSKALA